METITIQTENINGEHYISVTAFETVLDTYNRGELADVVLKTPQNDIKFSEPSVKTTESNRDKKRHQEWIYRIILPVEDNDRIPFPRSKIEEVKTMLLKLAGGLTIDDISIPRKGYWIDDQGEEKPDKVVLLIVGCKENQDAYFSEFKEKMKILFDQDDIRIERSIGLIL